jgi:hypothetical protein
MSEAVRVTGIRETQRALKKFSVKLADRVLLLSLRSGANLMLKQVRTEIKAHATKSGRMLRATGVAKSRINTVRKNGKLGLYVRVKKGKSRKDMKGAYYAGWIEKGFRPGRSRKGVPLVGSKRAYEGPTEVPGKHIFKKTYQANKEATAHLVMDLIEQGGIKLLNEIKGRK